jgi:aspartate/methionine/tyrosine aminotransferase
MKLTPFLLDQWLSEPADGPIEFDLGGSTGPHWTFRELLDLEGVDAPDRLLDSDVVYSLSAGGAGLRDAVAGMCQVPIEHVLVVGGASEALLHLFFLAAEPGANVVVPFPGFPPYHAIPESLGLEVRSYHLRRENDYRIDIDDVTRLLDARTRLMLINSPHNPTGAVPAAGEMRSLHDVAVERGIQFVVDEVFHPIYHGPERPSAVTLPGATVVGDCSKALALAGLRVGWIIEPDDARRAQYLNARQYFSISNTMAGELFAEIAVRHRAAVWNRTREVASANLRHLDHLLTEQAAMLECVRPGGGMTAFPRFVAGGDARGFCQGALRRGLRLTPGDCFGVPDHVRVGFGVGREWYPRAMERLGELLHEWAHTPQAV